MKPVKALPFAMLLGSLLMAGCAGGPDVPVLTPITTFDVSGDHPYQFKAPADGFFSLNDVNQDRSLYDGTIKKGQLLSIDPAEQTLSVGGKVAKDLRVPRGDTLQILFRATPTAS